MQLTHKPITLPILRSFEFKGASAYFEAVVCRITAPRLEELQIEPLEPRTFSVPGLAQFVDTTENLSFDDVLVMFKDKGIDMVMSSRRDGNTRAVIVTVGCWQLDCQLYVMAQLSSALSQLFSALEHLIFGREVPSQSSEEYNDVDRMEWRNILRWFSGVKTLYVADASGLVEQFSQLLGLEDSPLELLPGLQMLAYSGSSDTDDTFTSFVDARQNAGRPVTLIRHSPMPGTSRPYSDDPGSAITTGSGEARNDTDA